MTHGVKYGIAAQVALGKFLQDRLADFGWKLTMTSPGSVKDVFQGVDFHIETHTGDVYPLDVSFRDKPDQLVLVMKENWFTKESRRRFTQTGVLEVDVRRSNEILFAFGQVLQILEDAMGSK